MEQRRIEGKSHWYHETQSSMYPQDVMPLVPEASVAMLDCASIVNLPALQP